MQQDKYGTSFHLRVREFMMSRTIDKITVPLDSKWIADVYKDRCCLNRFILSRVFLVNGSI